MAEALKRVTRLLQFSLDFLASASIGNPRASNLSRLGSHEMSGKPATMVTPDYRHPYRFGVEKKGAGRFGARARAKGETPTVRALVPDLGNILPCAENLIKAMFLRVGGNAYQVASFEQASQMFCVARDKYGEGASNTPSPLIVDQAGSIIAHVSYNGRVWPGVAWTVDVKPLYDNRLA